MNILVTGANGQLGNEMRIVSQNTTNHYQVRQKQAELAREVGVTMKLNKRLKKNNILIIN